MCVCVWRVNRIEVLPYSYLTLRDFLNFVAELINNSHLESLQFIYLEYLV